MNTDIIYQNKFCKLLFKGTLIVLESKKKTCIMINTFYHLSKVANIWRKWEL